MARGRMLNKSVCASVKFNSLPDDTCRLLATWIIAHLDMNGVFYADPVMVKSMVFPRRADVAIEQVEGCLDAMENIGLMFRFDANGDRWQCWPGFDENQPGLRKERESTGFPFPECCRIVAGTMTDDCRNDDGKMPAEGEVKEKEREGEEKRNGNGNGKHPSPSDLTMGVPPAVAIILELTGQCHKSLHAQIDDAIGRDPPDLEFWRDVVRGWMACGWKPSNVNGMLDYFRRDEVPGEKRPSSGGKRGRVLAGRDYLDGAYAEHIKH